MTLETIARHIRQKKSYLCVGLDTDINKIPKHLLALPNPVLTFNKQIIDATKDLCVAYKINTAFYEAMGSEGWDIMQQTVEYIPAEHFTIADAKRGDIGNSSDQYAKAFFEVLGFDAVTIAPYMGRDSIEPFLQYPGKWAIVLGLTSNKGSLDFQQQRITANFLYEEVIRKVAGWGSVQNIMFVVGATKAEELTGIRKIIPNHFLLVPGVGFQGGSLAEVSLSAINSQVGLLINVSRAIIYAGEGENFALEAKEIARQYQHEMAVYIKD
jgi:orotidine-5'-phosphate decarboxylase